ncbi:hypothetical protein JK163_01455 [Levilactobacillus brevis]|uniref:hypothetical protein n=1 Tax=Levilactobacillus brevis TaxID=1580 RepID=UPI001BA7B80B|nr:hypothetical protein [Levilactobacillus brevis]MBS1004988.1 hypothetical protein [Levilactobacillus brevis]MBS1012520.1 hypothetical protein [Levilactobacillus brevis]
MTKKFRFCTFIILSFGLFTMFLYTTASASSWKKGTPKILIGNWHVYKDKDYRYSFTKKYLYTSWFHGAPIHRCDKLSYKKTKKGYVLKMYDYTVLKYNKYSYDIKSKNKFKVKLLGKNLGSANFYLVK